MMARLVGCHLSFSTMRLVCHRGERSRFARPAQKERGLVSFGLAGSDWIGLDRIGSDWIANRSTVTGHAKLNRCLRKLNATATALVNDSQPGPIGQACERCEVLNLLAN